MTGRHLFCLSFYVPLSYVAFYHSPEVPNSTGKPPVI